MSTIKREQMDIAPEKLLLDPHNPRLPLGITDLSQEDLLRVFERSYNLDPLALSIADNGYFPEEPMFVISGPNDNYIVIEGNRRLAAIIFLTDPKVRNESERTKRWEQLVKRMKYSLKTIPCIKYEKREDLDAILAFRHISGIMSWDPLPKAKFVNYLVEGENFDISFRRLADITGSSGGPVRDYYVSFRAYLQIKEYEEDLTKLENNYGVFYSALKNKDIKEFIGLNTYRKGPKALKFPIPKKGIDKIIEVIEFIHGTTESIAVITDSRQITDLGRILANEFTLQQLRATRDFDYSLSFLRGELGRLLERLILASKSLDESLQDAHRHKENADVQQYIKRCLETILELAKYNPSIKEELNAMFSEYYETAPDTLKEDEIDVDSRTRTK